MKWREYNKIERGRGKGRVVKLRVGVTYAFPHIFLSAIFLLRIVVELKS